MNKINWKLEYCGLEFGVIALAEFFGPLAGQTTRKVVGEVQTLSEAERLELFLLLLRR